MTANLIRKSGWRLVTLFGALTLISLIVQAQEERKKISMPAPSYPHLARQLNLSGVVKIKAVVSADGEVKETEVVGGHPLLADSALNALKHWRYAPAKTETTVVVEFRFHP
jgi:TonB family protein